MGEIDIAKEHPNVTTMKILDCKLVPVTRGTRTLKDAVDSAFEEYMKDPVNFLYSIGSVVGPHPYPKMVRDCWIAPALARSTATSKTSAGCSTKSLTTRNVRTPS
jgi:tryptophan synthase beta subunit